MPLEEHLLKSSCGEFTRKSWLMRQETTVPHKLCVILDAEFYLNKMEAPAIFEELMSSGAIPSMSCLFISHVDGAARHKDYTCNPRFARFIAQDVMEWVSTQCPDVATKGNLICGLSLSGLAGAHIALSYPEKFSAALCQSGSFWWNQEWLTAHLSDFPASQGRFWLSVGDQELEVDVAHPPTGMRQEVTQVAGCEHFSAALQARGHAVHYTVFAGGHEFAPWKAELKTALLWLTGQ